MEFHTNLMGFDIYDKYEWVPKYILYWSNYNSHDILVGRTKFKVIEKHG